MKINHLRDIVMVAEKGSLRSAARELGIAQPAITRSIHEVESALGAVVFERSARGAVPTPVGERFIVRATAILAELDRAKEEAAHMSIGTGITVSIALSAASHIALLPRVLERFRSRYPNVLLSIRDALFHAVEHDIERGALDFFIGPLPLEPLGSDFIEEFLFDNRQIVICRKGHPLADARTLAELEGAQWVATLPPKNAGLDANFAGHHIDRSSVALHADSSVTILLAVANSDLLAMPPQQWASFPLASDQLQQIVIEDPLPGPSIYSIRRRRLPLTPPAQFLFDQLVRAGENIKAAATEQVHSE